MVMTPLILGLEVDDNGLNQMQFDDFQLEPEENLRSSKKDRHTRSNRDTHHYRPRFGSTWHIVENQLEEIIEEDKGSENEQEYESNFSQLSNSILSEISEVEDSVIDASSRIQTEKISFNNLQVQERSQPLLLEWAVDNPKAQLFNKLKKISINEEIQSNEAKIEAFKETISNYIFQFEKYYFQESFDRITNETEWDLKKFQQIIFQGISQTFRKKIGGLSFEKRRVKLLKYMDKKKRRVWQKKVNYDCRKKVADCRLRIKGKFVTLEQACEQLGIPENQSEKPENVKELLLRRYTKAQ